MKSKRPWISLASRLASFEEHASVGGNVGGADAGLTEAQLRSLSGHKNASTMIRYARETSDQQRQGARKRRDLRTKKRNCRNREIAIVGMTSRDLYKCLKGLVGAPGLEPGTR